MVIRLMAPFSMRCNRCGEYICTSGLHVTGQGESSKLMMRGGLLDKGKKFNARKETAQNEEYYGIKIFRFYIVCPHSHIYISFNPSSLTTSHHSSTLRAVSTPRAISSSACPCTKIDSR